MQYWNERYVIGNDRIDLEHRTFFSLINNFSEAHRGNAPKEKLERVLDEIALYAKFHFRSEENYMQDIAYPHFAVHKAHHRNLVNDFDARFTGFQLGRVPAPEVEDFLVLWLTTHVTHEDIQIAKYVEDGTVG